MATKVDTTPTPEMITAAETFLNEKAKDGGEGLYTVKGSDVERYYADNGLPSDVIRRQQALASALLAGSINFVGTRLIDQIKEIKGQSGDPETAHSELRIQTGPVTMEVEMTPHVARKIPTHLPGMADKPVVGDGISHHYGVVRVQNRMKSALHKHDECLNRWAADVQAALG